MIFTLYKNIVSKKLCIAACCLLFLALPFAKTIAQPIPVGDTMDEQYRLLQLLSDSTIQTSLSNRPLWFSTYDNIFGKNDFNTEAWWGTSMRSGEINYAIGNYEMKAGAYRPVFNNTYNTELPYGENNGAAWYGRGLNSELKAGFYITSDYLTLTLRPHLIHTQNKDFETPRFIPTYPDGSPRYVAQGILPEVVLGDRIDRPFRFGPDSYQTLDWGQSSLRLHYNEIEAGISNETLWWGPGVRYALAMSNNAAGLPHAFIGTREPLNLPYNIGDLEFRWIFAWPQDSQFFDLNIAAGPTPDKLKALNSTRFTNGLNIIYTPSFLPNLSVGVSRVIHQYVDNNVNIFEVFTAFEEPIEQVFNDARDDSHFEDKNPIASTFFRWVLPESNAEFYGELYRGDHNVNFRDFLMEPQHGRGYTLGVQKLLEFNGAINFLRINAEVNSLLPGRIDDVRPQTYYYTHQTVKQGHTNRGEVLGAAIGPGSESQFIGVDAFFKQGKLGFFVQRMVDNNFFHYEHQQRYFPGGGFKDQFRHRVNLNLGLTGTYKLGPLLLDGAFTWNKNFNYGRFDLGEPGFYTIEGNNVINLQYRLSVKYAF